MNAPYSFTTRCPDDYLSGVVDPDETLPEGVEHISDALGRLISDLAPSYRAEGPQVVNLHSGRRLSVARAKDAALDHLAMVLAAPNAPVFALERKRLDDILAAIWSAKDFDPTPPPAANALAAPVEKAA